jgi:hypothetical protein
MTGTKCCWAKKYKDEGIQQVFGIPAWYGIWLSPMGGSESQGRCLNREKEGEEK